MKGKNGKNELEDAKNAAKTLLISLEQDDEFILCDPSAKDETEAKRHILVFRKTAPTPTKYPRKNAQIQKKPI